MIPKRYIEEWKQTVPWIDNNQVEQDLIISRALVAIYSDSFLMENLAFRGGTALHKLYASPASRYSEDIDLVQIKPGPIGDVITQLRKALLFIEGPKPTIDRGVAMTTLRFRYVSESSADVTMKLKVEINCREHIAVYGLKHFNYSVSNSWFTGSAHLITFEPEELLATKLRALYQRKKGRDLFDLWYLLTTLNLNPERIISAFNTYMKLSQLSVRRKDFLVNLEEKINDSDFRKDIFGLIHPSITCNIDEAYAIVRDSIVMLLME